MTKAYLVTCGTSVIGNYCGKMEIDRNPEAIARRIGKPKDAVEDIADAIAEYACGMGEEGMKDISAEVKTLLSLKRKEGFDRGDHVVLFCTGTDGGKIAAGAVRAMLERHILGPGYVDVEVIDSIRAAKKDLERGLPDLLKRMMRRFKDFESEGIESVFVVTGGYKAMTASAASLAMLLAKRCYYLFESSEGEAVDIGVLPLAVRMDKIPSGVFDAISMKSPLKYSELKKGLNLEDKDINLFFTKAEEDDRRYRPSAMAHLLEFLDKGIETCKPEAEITVSEAGRSHDYPEWGKIRSVEDIPDKKVRELLHTMAAALHKEAENLSLGEFNGNGTGEGDKYRVRYKGKHSGTIRLELRMPHFAVFLSAHPKAGRLDELDFLCKSLFKDD